MTEKHAERAILWIFAVYAGVILFLTLILAVAHAEPPPGADPNSAMSQWYRSLQVPDSNASCCSVADCRPVEARETADGWEILLDAWTRVPPQAVLHRNNLDGRPIACVIWGEIRCFIPPAGA